MALVVDYENSERGPQRRKNARGRLLHCCCICGKLDVWRDGWTTYCSWRDIDDEAPVPKFCSSECRAKGGVAAKAVSEAMKQVAKDAEWREPTLVYREQTEREKYNNAAAAQHRQQQQSQSTDTGSVT